MVDDPIQRRRGRPPLDPDDPSVSVCLRLPGKSYDAVYRDARQARMTISDYVRDVLARRRVERPQTP